MPQALATRFAVFLVSTVATTVIPVLVQDRPVIKWTWEKYGPVIQTRAQKRIEDRLAPPRVDPVPSPEVVTPTERPFTPAAHNDDVVINSGAYLNPNRLCRHHWWKAGPIRWAISLPFRLF